MINRLRIEHSHTMQKCTDLESRNSLLHKTMKQTKQQYAVLYAKNKKLDAKNKDLQQRYNDLLNNKDREEMSVSLKTQISSLEDTHRKETIKNEINKNLKYYTLTDRDRIPSQKWFGKCENCYTDNVMDELIIQDIQFIKSLIPSLPPSPEPPLVAQPSLLPV